MALFTELRQRAKHAIGPVLGIGIFGYFAYHAVEGQRGLFAYMRLTERVAEAQAVRDAARAEREEWELRVRLLKPGHADPDMLDERARQMLNLVQPDEIVVFTNRLPRYRVDTPVPVPLPPLR